MALKTGSASDTVAVTDQISSTKTGTAGSSWTEAAGFRSDYYGIRDGRRRSNPLTSKSTSPTRAPDWQLSRVLAAAATAETNFTKRSDGVNASEFETIRFSVTPMTADPTVDPSAVLGGSGNPDVEARIWNEQAKLFVPFPTPITKSGGGAGVPYVINVPIAYGAIVGCFITNSPGGVVAIAAQGFNQYLL